MKRIRPLFIGLLLSTLSLTIFLVLLEGAAIFAFKHPRVSAVLSSNIELEQFGDSGWLTETPPEELSVPEGVTKLSIRDDSSPYLRERYLDIPALRKKENVIVLGGSSPWGIGLENRSTFWWELNGALNLPESVGVLNLARIGGRTDEARAALGEYLSLGGIPTVALLYAGDNEWVGYRHHRPESSFVFTLDSMLRQSKAYLAALGIYRYLRLKQDNLPRLAYFNQALVEMTPTCFTGRLTYFDETMRDDLKRIRSGLLSRFEINVRAIIEATKARGGQMVLFTTPLKYRLPPCHNIAQPLSERWLSGPEHERLEMLVGDGVAALSRKEFPKAKELLEAAQELDPDSAMVNYYLAYAYEGQGELERARHHLGLSREGSIGHGGLMLSLNDTIRKLARSEGVLLVDLQRVFDEYSSAHGKGFNDELIHDWCHPNELGNALIRENLLAAYRSAGS